MAYQQLQPTILQTHCSPSADMYWWLVPFASSLFNYHLPFGNRSINVSCIPLEMHNWEAGFQQPPLSWAHWISMDHGCRCRQCSRCNSCSTRSGRGSLTSQRPLQLFLRQFRASPIALYINGIRKAHACRKEIHDQPQTLPKLKRCRAHAWAVGWRVHFGSAIGVSFRPEESLRRETWNGIVEPLLKRSFIVLLQFNKNNSYKWHNILHTDYW